MVEFPVITVALVTDVNQYPMAHDVIEAVSLPVNDQQPFAEEPKAIEFEEEGVNSMQLMTGKGAIISEKLIAVKEESEDIPTSVQHNGLLIEELKAAAH